jgi:glycosyltransferase involved in cell wall biosynthesis
MNDIHVLHLIDGLTFGGAETLLRDLAAGLEKRGYRITVGYSTPGPFVQELIDKGLTLKHIPRMGLIDPVLMFRMIKLMRNDPPQIVHTHLFKSDFHGRLAARLAGVPVVVSTLHNNDSWAKNWLLGHIYGATAYLVDRLIAVSSEVKAYHLMKTGVPSKKMLVIENGVDVTAFSGKEAEAEKIRQEFDIAPHAPLLGIVGRLKPQKDLPTFLFAATKILQERPDSRFLVVGDGPLLDELQEQAHELGLLPSLIFTGMRKDIPSILASLNIVVLSSLWEGLPVILLEGMAAARPFVSTSVDGVIGVAIPNETALLVPPGNPSELAGACLKLIRDPQLSQRMGLAGRERVMHKYSLNVMIDHISALYVELLLSKGVAASKIFNIKKTGS